MLWSANLNGVSDRSESDDNSDCRSRSLIGRPSGQINLHQPQAKSANEFGAGIQRASGLDGASGGGGRHCVIRCIGLDQCAQGLLIHRLPL